MTDKELQDAINEELRRIEPATEGEDRTLAELDGDTLMVWWGNREDIAQTAVRFLRVEAKRMLELLRAIPDGAAIEEGVDGSLWEIIMEADQCGFTSAGRYLREHHTPRAVTS